VKNKVHIDFETYSEADIRKVGAWAYSRHPSTEVICAAYTCEDCPVSLWVPGDKLPDFMNELRAYELHAFNSFFEMSIWKNVLGWPETKINQWHDTSALTTAQCLPRTLLGCCTALGLPDDKQKDKRGKYLINRLCKPYKGERIRDPELLEELYDYCKQDVVAEREVSKRILELNDTERKVWLLDQKINTRGVLIDRGTTLNAVKLMDETINELNDKVFKLTSGVLTKVSERLKVMRYIENFGYILKEYTKGYLTEVLKDPRLPSIAKELIEIRLSLGKTSVKKYEALLNIIDTDNRARGLLRYHAASTGRWGGNLFQPQNLPRGSIKDTETAITAINNGSVGILYEDTMEVLSSCIRGMIIAPKDKKLIVADYSSIEARVLPWLAGQDDILKVFESGQDVYKHTANKIYKCGTDNVNKEQRFIGKVATLALGYQGGAKAFAGMAANYGVDIDEQRAEHIKNEWRTANYKIVKYWHNVERAALLAVDNPGDVVRVGKIQFKVEGQFLYCRLPSGRLLSYFKPEIRKSNFNKPAVCFLGNDSQTRQFNRQFTYGGKIVENITQGVARDLMAHAMLNLEDAGFEIVLTVHDEVIAEASKDRSVDEFIRIMIDKPAWAKGCPIDADGFETMRYRK